MSVAYYTHLLADERRIEAFRRAIDRVVCPGHRVLEIGTGLGTYAFFAARAGAGRVQAVEHSPILHVAESLAAGNGLGGRIDFVRGKVPEVDLEGDVDVLVYEDFPTALLDRAVWEMLARVQEELLAPGARMIPGAARLVVAPVESEGVHRSVFPAALAGEGGYGLDWAPVRLLAATTPRRMSLEPEALVGRPFAGPRIPLLPLPVAGETALEAEWEADTAGRVHALALWFDLEVSEGDWISNAPGPGAGPWGQWVLPLDPPLEVSAGERVEAVVSREALENGAVGWMRWEARAGSDARVGHEFGGLLIDPDDLLGGADRRPGVGNGRQARRVSREHPVHDRSEETKR